MIPAAQVCKSDYRPAFRFVKNYFQYNFSGYNGTRQKNSDRRGVATVSVRGWEKN
jgi:hypothetical protein